MSRHGRPDLRWLLTTAPAVEPIVLADVKQHRRIDASDTSQDTLIPLLIQKAREYAEFYTGRAFITQKWQAVLDSFPDIIVPPTPFTAVAAWLPNPQPSPELYLHRGPLQSVQSIQYLDQNGVQQTLDAASYTVDLTGIFPRIAPVYGKQWPQTLAQIGAVSINATFGYGDTAAAVPAGIRHWMLLRVGTIFENREEVVVMNRGKVELLPIVDGLLDPYKMPVI